MSLDIHLYMTKSVYIVYVYIYIYVCTYRNVIYLYKNYTYTLYDTIYAICIHYMKHTVT